MEWRQLCENGKSACRTRDDLIPSITEAWMCSSWTITSPGWAMVEKKPMLASYPELKRRAVSDWKNFLIRSSRFLCACPFTRSLEPLVPRMSGASLSFLRNRFRSSLDVDKERKSLVWKSIRFDEGTEFVSGSRRRIMRLSRDARAAASLALRDVSTIDVSSCNLYEKQEGRAYPRGIRVLVQSYIYLDANRAAVFFHCKTNVHTEVSGNTAFRTKFQ